MNDALNKAKKFVVQLRNDGVEVDSAFLFGSYAKGTQHKDSDIDVCIVSQRFGKDYIEEMVDLRMKALKIDIRIEPIPLTPRDLADPYSSLSTEIRNTGLAIT
ncbi:MAG: nucleotidyltransferase domain-containing protein [Patescibacteria group bacterium]|nr:nucleotidyltransferase domain-containing protein [Patescibacteria group bacterium]MCL5432105.1 nucleotidyltransferase domain-containing protein [Patescibacteria group bacterium]